MAFVVLLAIAALGLLYGRGYKGWGPSGVGQRMQRAAGLAEQQGRWPEAPLIWMFLMLAFVWLCVLVLWSAAPAVAP